MANRSRRSHGRSGGSRLPSARVAWLPAADGALSGTLDDANTFDETTLYDFGGTQKYTDNYGGGDWTLVRHVGSVGIGVAIAPTTTVGLIKVCFGIGMINARTTVTDAAGGTIVSPLLFPELSWMVNFCCYINVSELSVERCAFDLKSQRIISERSIMAVAVYTDPVIVDTTLAIDYSIDLRQVIRQRGSRL